MNINKNIKEINIQLENIDFVQFFEMKDKSIFKFAFDNYEFEPIDYFNVGSFQKRSFGYVKDMQFYLQRKSYIAFASTIIRLIQLTAKELEVEEIKLFKLGIIKMYQAYLYLFKQAELINEAEKNGLSSEPTSKEIKAGIERFNNYGVFIQIYKLCNGDLLKYKEILKQEYSLCFTKLKYDKDLADYKLDYSKIK